MGRAGERPPVSGPCRGSPCFSGCRGAASPPRWPPRRARPSRHRALVLDAVGADREPARAKALQRLRGGVNVASADAGEIDAVLRGQTEHPANLIDVRAREQALPLLALGDQGPRVGDGRAPEHLVTEVERRTRRHPPRKRRDPRCPQEEPAAQSPGTGCASARYWLRKRPAPTAQAPGRAVHAGRTGCAGADDGLRNRP